MKRCMVCGAAPTVRAHLFPRALSHDIRRDAHHVIAVGLNNPRTRFLQSGQWSDRIVCRVHEDVFGTIDDYAVTFCRTFEQRFTVLAWGMAVTVPNPRPDLLVMFAHAVVWRHAADLLARGRRHWLGPYFQIIEDALFRGGPALDMFVIEPGNVSQGKRVIMGVHPCPSYMGPLNLTRFEIGGLGFMLKTDQRPFPPEIALFAGRRDPLRVLTMDAVEIAHNPTFRAIAAAVRAKRGSDDD